MKTITFTTYWGNFNYSVTTAVEEGVSKATEALALEGVANIAYRPAASAAMKAFFTKEQIKAWKAQKANGEREDESDSLRRSVVYSDDNVAKFTKGAQDKLDEIVKDKGLAAITLTVIGQHVYGEKENVTTKEATEIWTALQSEKDEAVFIAKCKFLGIDPEAGDDVKAITAIRNWRLDIKRKAEQTAKDELANVGK